MPEPALRQEPLHVRNAALSINAAAAALAAVPTATAAAAAREGPPAARVTARPDCPAPTAGPNAAAAPPAGLAVLHREETESAALLRGHPLEEGVRGGAPAAAAVGAVAAQGQRRGVVGCQRARRAHRPRAPRPLPVAAALPQRKAPDEAVAARAAEAHHIALLVEVKRWVHLPVRHRRQWGAAAAAASAAFASACARASASARPAGLGAADGLRGAGQGHGLARCHARLWC